MRFCHHFKRSWCGLFQNVSCALGLMSTFLLVGSIYGRPSINIGRKHLWKALYKHCSFRPDPLTSITTIGNYCFWLVDFWKSSPLKPVDYIILNCTGIIYGRSSIGFPNVILLGQKHVRYGQFLVVEWIVLRVFDSLSMDFLNIFDRFRE